MDWQFWRTKAAPPLSRRAPVWATAWAGPEVPRTYEAMVRASYLGNPIASRAVRMIAEGAGGAPLVSTPPGHPALALLATPGMGASGPGLIESLAAQLLLHGNAYVEVATGPDGLPAALYALRPERVTVETDSRGWPTGYLYRTGDSVPAIRRKASATVSACCTSGPSIRSTIIMVQGALPRRRPRSTCTMRRRGGTRRCLTMRRGHRGRWCTSRVTGRR